MVSRQSFIFSYIILGYSSEGCKEPTLFQNFSKHRFYARVQGDKKPFVSLWKGNTRSERRKGAKIIRCLKLQKNMEKNLAFLLSYFARKVTSYKPNSYKLHVRRGSYPRLCKQLCLLLLFLAAHNFVVFVV